METERQGDRERGRIQYSFFPFCYPLSYSFANGHVDCYHVIIIVNGTTVNMSQMLTSLPSAICSEMTTVLLD